MFGGRLQNNSDHCKTIVVSVTVRSRLGKALYTVGKKTANCKIRLRNNAHRICLLFKFGRRGGPGVRASMVQPQECQPLRVIGRSSLASVFSS
jgi:hypothetical protein